jgi:hypothetical protein
METYMKSDVVSAPSRGPPKALAALNHVEPQSILKRLCQTGSFHGLVPDKLATGMWDWPLVRVKRQKSTAAPAASQGSE